MLFRSYFSIPARFAENNFELDYWGLSYRTAMEYLLAHDPTPVIAMYPTSSPGWSTMYILTPEQRNRIVLTDEKSATYILDNFKLHDWKKFYPAEKEIYSVTVDGMKILTIYKP